MRLKGKTALVTGGSQGIGYAIAEAFIREGAKVIIAARSEDKLKKAQEQIGKGVLIFPVDVTSVSDLDRLYHFCGHLDIVVANAGISQNATPCDAMTEDYFDQIVDTNFKGAFFTVGRAVPYLKEGGSVILISSLAAKQGLKHFAAYCASKAAALSLAQSFAAELVSKKIRVNSISPGVVRTPILEAVGLSEEELRTWVKAIPMQRVAEPKEIAEAAVFLASDQSSYITGTDIAVDGGVSGISPL